MITPKDKATELALRAAIDLAYLADESQLLTSLARCCDDLQHTKIRTQAHRLVKRSREAQHPPLLTNFLNEFSLSSDEGIVLMCLAEALLRIPDAATQSRLIRDKLGDPDWESHIGHSPSLLVNASAWGLLLTGSLVKPNEDDSLNTGQFLKSLLRRLGEPLIRQALQRAMQLLGGQFVAGETLTEAIQNSAQLDVCSYDMLGEAALTTADAEHYLERYRSALLELGELKTLGDRNAPKHSISVKLSALHPRFEYAQRKRVELELIPKLIELAELAKRLDIDLTLDAEEASRLDLMLNCFNAVFSHLTLNDWNGLGLAVQAYQKRALPVLQWLRHLAQRHAKVIPLRLVKGAYWDTEIKLAQTQGLRGYPVFTRKQATDVSYLACARYLLKNTPAFFPQFGTHNALTIASIQQLASDQPCYEFQRLYGMGENLHRSELQRPCRVYVPVGRQGELMPYLVRRMLENGANTSFVYQAGDPDVGVETLLTDPLEDIKRFNFSPHPAIKSPERLYAGRQNSHGINFDSPTELKNTHLQLSKAAKKKHLAEPLLNRRHQLGYAREIFSLADQNKNIGQVFDTDPSSISKIIADAAQAHTSWSKTSVETRAGVLEAAANLIEKNQHTLMYLCIHEAGRCLRDAQAEVREAIDFCRYYAMQARQLFNAKQPFEGVVGEHNKGHWRGRGVFVCISPWNFPIAIFSGQIVAALVAGNSVIAKPASATPLCGMQVIKYLHEAGVPKDVLQYIPGPSEQLGALLMADTRISGVAMTGSIETAQKINQRLAARDAPIASIIAETGGQNVMISDSSALPEQLVKDVIRSAFNSAGQRCSALRVLFLAEEIADDTLKLLKAAMQQLNLGNPADESTDIGPLIDGHACEKSQRHIDYLKSISAPIFQIALPERTNHGAFFPPSLCELEDIQQLRGEVFGPILHVIRYCHENLDPLIESINLTGYGLTLGIHSRIESTIERICQRANVGNIYVNRDMIGATVGSQPFGGCGLSGTGPKAGGPHYLSRFANEVTVSENSAAIGGNPSLLMLDGHQR